MEPLDVFSVRDLRTRSGDLLKDAEAGQLAIITKHGRPAILAVPFDQRLLQQGVHRALALALFEQRRVTLAQAAKLAGLSLDAFMDLFAVPRPLPTSSPRHTPRGAECRRARDTAGAVSRAGPRVIAAGTMIKAVTGSSASRTGFPSSACSATKTPLTQDESE
ncbi:type II toxin-antitoxin system prevent-host-death family antitoxin [Thiohalocapsa sp. ML1]|uniref:type II toxin-antitoxin system prevent-host-death family antitoxin n=1 Tax=Thiohalocapsa sp. ML1 TaxID=1431688 RepID=UPI0020B1211F|nr:type II toxin-antitoxin system prevent-host-death family antitoxin [Thiohalocapsa sp. ML1]